MKLVTLDQFFITGISYKNADAALRGEYAISPEAYENILKDANGIGLDSLFVLSTCNRTEIYGFAGNVYDLAELLCRHTSGGIEQFNAAAYRLQGREAIMHLFSVGAGLDSQLLGDYEIAGQLKQAVKFARQRSSINGLTERMVNHAIQTSRAIKNGTDLSSGSVSVALAAVKYIKTAVNGKKGMRILLIGTGKIGQAVAKHLSMHMNDANVTLMNRTDLTAATIACQLGFSSAPFERMNIEIDQADIIITALRTDTPVINSRNLRSGVRKMMIDIAIPANVDPTISLMPGIQLVAIDSLSRQAQVTMSSRSAAIPKAAGIVHKNVDSFIQWCLSQENGNVLGRLKRVLNKVSDAHQHELNNPETRCPFIAAEQILLRSLNQTDGSDTGPAAAARA